MKKFIFLCAGLAASIFGFWAHRAYSQSFSSSSQGYTATTSAIGGSLLAIGASASTTVTINGVQVGMNCEATTTDGTDLFVLGAMPVCTVTSTNTVTVRMVAIVALTPPSKTINVRVK